MSKIAETPYNYISIEGNIGAGKTTLCKMLAQDLNWRLILEQFSDNPFLTNFYKEPERHAFTVELFFMSERYQQLRNDLIERDLFQQRTIADYFFIKTLLFANKTLQGEEYRLFQRFFNILNSEFPKPDLLVYLHRPIPVLLENIRRRGRSYEQEIDEAYLKSIQDAYLNYFKVEAGIPILLIEAGEEDFVKDQSVYEQIKAMLQVEYPKGLNRLRIGEEE